MKYVTETFKEGNRQWVTFETLGGHVIQGFIAEVTVCKNNQGYARKRSVEIVDAYGTYLGRFTFLTEAAWVRATGQAELFPETRGGNGHQSSSTRPSVGADPATRG